MRQILQIIGAEVVSKNKMKIVCIPYTSKEVKEKRPSLLDMAGGGLQEIIQQAQEQQSNKTIFYVTLDEWLNIFKNKLFSKIKIDIDMEVN